MRLGGRMAAAIEILEDIGRANRPVSVSLADWGKAHRFAGSGDRAAIGNIVYDVMRCRLSNAHAAGDDTPSALVFAALVRQWKMTPDAIREALAGDAHAPAVPDGLEGIAEADFAFADAHVEADIPQWLADPFEEAFDDEWVEEAKAFTGRPPLDLRVNTLKADREKVIRALAAAGACPAPLARNGVRIAPPQRDGRLPNVQAEPAFQKGWFEVQDAGSQVIADLVLAEPGEQVFDLCAGAGGKTLALAASMDNKGQVHAWDADKQRLAPIFDRLKRAGTRNVQVHAANEDLSPLEGRFDRVVVDAPCTGSGTWRRHPDAKWKLTPEALEKRIGEQAAILDNAVRFLRPGGTLCYMTCSVLPAENDEQVAAFLERHPGFEPLSVAEAWIDLHGENAPQPWSAEGVSLTLTPRATATDGFFFAALAKDG